MTKAIINNLNNIDEIMNFRNDFKPESSKVANAMDKSTSTLKNDLNTKTENFSNADFKNVLNKKLDNESKTVNLKTSNNEKTQTLTINDMKTSDNTEQQDDLDSLKEVLNSALSEANVQTSLDLTLSKDITEIISQLKVAIENIEEISDDTKEIEETESSSLGILDEITQDIMPNIVRQDTILQETNNVSSENSDLSKVLMTYIDKVDFSKNLVDENKIDTTNTLQFEENNITEMVETLDIDTDLIKPAQENSTESELTLEEDLLKELNIESIEAQADTNQDNFSMQKHSPEEHAIKTMISNDTESFDLKFDTIQTSSKAQSTQAKPVEINSGKILEQITKQLEGLQNNSKVNIVLNPESLGKVNIQLLNTKEGLMAQFTVTTPEARDVLMKGLDGLKETLLAQGVNVENVSVRLSDTQKSSYNQDWTEQEGSRGGNKEQGRSNKEEKEKGLFEKTITQTFEEEEKNGNV